MAWFGLAKIALQAGSKIYANRQRTKMAMSDAQLMHAERMARGEESYQGKLRSSAKRLQGRDRTCDTYAPHPGARLVGVDRGSGGYAENRYLF